jgi:hypothetical protein
MCLTAIVSISAAGDRLPMVALTGVNSAFVRVLKRQSKKAD